MSDFTTDRAARLDDLRGALLAAAAEDLREPDGARGGAAASVGAAAPAPVGGARPLTATRHPRRRNLGTARARLALAFLLVAVAIPGVVIGSGLIGPERAVANGLPAGTTTMTAVQPECAAIRAGVEYECAFAAAPRVGPLIRTVDASGKVDGGCRSQNAIETFWICYFGKAAVNHQVVAQGVL
jgi:hypothetical protein